MLEVCNNTQNVKTNQERPTNGFSSNEFNNSNDNKSNNIYGCVGLVDKNFVSLIKTASPNKEKNDNIQQARFNSNCNVYGGLMLKKKWIKKIINGDGAIK